MMVVPVECSPGLRLYGLSVAEAAGCDREGACMLIAWALILFLLSVFELETWIQLRGKYKDTAMSK